jgi:hypothetical protein
MIPSLVLRWPAFATLVLLLDHNREERAHFSEIGWCGGEKKTEDEPSNFNDMP